MSVLSRGFTEEGFIDSSESFDVCLCAWGGVLVVVLSTFSRQLVLDAEAGFTRQGYPEA